MRRTRRHKFLQISLLFLIYSIIHVYSQKKDVEVEVKNETTQIQSQLTNTLNIANKTVDLAKSSLLGNESNAHTTSTSTIAPTTTKVTTIAPTPTKVTTIAPTTTTVTTTHKPKTNTDGPVQSTTSQPKTEHSPLSTTTPLGKSTLPTLRPKRKNCTPPAIEQV